MAIAEKSIIEPGASDARRPIQKATVWWLLGGASIAFLSAYYVPKLLVSKGSGAQKEFVEAPRQTGTEKSIEVELANAAKSAEVKEQPAPQQGPAASMPPAPTPLPASTTANTTAGERAYEVVTPPAQDVQRKSGNVPDIDEIEVQARMSKALVTDVQDQRAQGSRANGVSESEVDARMSGLTVDPSAAADSRAAGGSSQADLLARLASAQAASANGSRQSDKQWLKEYADIKPAAAIKPTRVSSPYTLIQGKVIPAVLGKALNSDLPGDITAFTTIDVYDSLRGNTLLIPKGSQLVGEYSNQIRDGQGRLMFAFSRIVLPNGMSYSLPSARGQDVAGMAGIAGSVDNHYFKRFTSGVLVALLADRLERNNTQPVTNINSSGPTSAAGQVLSEIAKADLSKNMGIPPTITVREGTRINVQVVADMEFPGAYKGL